MIFGYFTLLVALTISAVAEFYSIVGLTAIFSAAFWPIVIMGASLGVGKVTAAVWLKLNWERASWTYKLYLVPAVAFLMVLTSMGIFGFLSKAHSDQSLVSGDSMAKVAIYDEKIKTAKDNIEANRTALKQMDSAVDQVMGRSTDEKGADKAVGIRRSQAKERTRLLAEIENEQRKVSALSEERAPYAAEFRKVESEVGPIKYIAALVYGDNPDSNLLEKAVRLVIILIVAVFDPLALVLILAAQQSIRWAREEKQEKHDVEQFMEGAAQELLDDIDLQEQAPPSPEPPLVVDPAKSIFESHPYLLKPFDHFKNTTPIVANRLDIVDTSTIPDVERPGDYVTQPTNWEDAIVESDDDEEDPHIKEAIRQWKADNPNDTVKHQRRLHEQGRIDQLPWLKELDTKDGFGPMFPSNPGRGDTFVLTSVIPNRLCKFNGIDWITVDKSIADNYTYDTAYIDHLIARIESGEYDPELLSDSEREQVAEQLNQSGKA